MHTKTAPYLYHMIEDGTGKGLFLFWLYIVRPVAGKGRMALVG
jgi:hypothetical protein